MVFQNYFAQMPTPSEQLAQKQEELQRLATEYNADQQALNVKLQGLIKTQGAVEALRELIDANENSEEE